MNIYKRHPFPPYIISYAVGLIHLFNLTHLHTAQQSAPVAPSRHSMANAFEKAIIKIELPGHDQVSHRGTVLIPDGGAVILTATSSALNGSVEPDKEVVLVLRAKAQTME